MYYDTCVEVKAQLLGVGSFLPGIEIVLSGSQCLYLLSHPDGLCNSVVVGLSLSFIRAVGFSELVAYLFSFGIIYILKNWYFYEHGFEF